MKKRLGNSPLGNRGSGNLNISLEKEKIVKEYGRLVHMKEELIKLIDFSDKTFINRLEIESKDLELDELKESIKNVGLLNIVYLQEKDKGNYRIVSGLRRASAIKEIYSEGDKIKGNDRVIILDKSTPYDLLDTISVDENIQRKNLTIIEQSVKFNKEASRKDKKIDDILTEYKISKKAFYRIKNAINYPEAIKDIIEKVGTEKAEMLNKIYTLSKSTPEEILAKFKDLSRDDLRTTLKALQKNKKVEKVLIKEGSKSLNLTIKKKLPTDVVDYFKKIKQMIEEEDYSFID